MSKARLTLKPVFCQTVIPSNCLVWVGASLFGSLNQEIDKFMVKATEYEGKLPDRYGDAFLNPLRKSGEHFNKEFEEEQKRQKHMLYN